MKRVLIVTSTFERAHFFPDGFDEWMVGVTGVEIAAEHPLDGVNLIPYLTGERDETPHEYLFWEMIGSGGAPRGRQVEGGLQNRHHGALRLGRRLR